MTSDDDDIINTGCPICYEITRDPPLECGHIFHNDCLEKHFKAECPVCRHPHTRVKPRGQIPRSSPGRTMRYIRDTALSETVKIKFDGDAKPSNECYKLIIENALTKKNKGEVLSKDEEKLYKEAMSIIGNFTADIISI